MADTAPPVGLAGMESMTSDTAAWMFFVQQMMAQAAHVALVQVKSVKPSGEGAATGSVSVQPMVHQIDGQGTVQQHGIINNLAYCRIQGGTSAIIIDPVAGDIGIAVFCDRDSSVVKKTQAPSQPGSFRRFDWADGIYIGGTLNGAPTQYIEFLPDNGGIRFVATSDSAKVATDGSMTLNPPHIPSSSGDVGEIGQIAWGPNFIYVCVAPNTWKRSAIASW